MRICLAKTPSYSLYSIGIVMKKVKRYGPNVML
jgi:hypothetical protein